MHSLSKDLKKMGEQYAAALKKKTTQVVNEQDATDVLNFVQKTPLPAATSGAGSADKVKQDFDVATTTYLKSLNVSDADIKKFIDSTHTMLQGFTNKSKAPAIGAAPQAAPVAQPAVPQAATPQVAATPQAPAAAPVASTAQYLPTLGGRGLTGRAGARPAYASK